MTHISSAERQPVNIVNSGNYAIPPSGQIHTYQYCTEAAVTPLSDLFADYYQISDGSPKNTT